MTSLDVGVVKSIEAVTGRPFVEVARRTGRHVLGPCPVVEGVWTATLLVESPSPAVSGSASAGTAHTHTIGHDHGAGLDLAVGDRVLVGYLDTSNAAVVLGRLR